MKISVLVSDPDHPVTPWVQRWVQACAGAGHQAELVNKAKGLAGGDLLFLVSCNEIIRADTRSRYSSTLVVHASDLPAGRGWSPYIWAVLDGADRIDVCLLEAREPVDTGEIWFRDGFDLEGHELLTEIHEKLFETEIRLMSRAVESYGSVTPQPQPEESVSYLRKRSPEDSKLDPTLSIESQFDLLRVCDAARFPAFFDMRGHRYTLSIEKLSVDETKKREPE